MADKLSKAVVGVNEEATAYTFDAPAAAETWPAFDITIAPSGDSYQRQEARQILDKLDEVPGPASMEIGFKTLLVGSGSAGTAPHFDHALLGCGMQQTVTAATSVVYKPTSTFDGAVATGPPVVTNPYESVSVAVFEDGRRYALKGGHGTVKFVCKSGEPIVMEFLFRGAYVATADVAVPTPTGVSTATPATFLSAGLTNIGSFAVAFETLEYDLANDIQPLVDANNASGIKGYQIVDRRMFGRFDPDMTTVSDDDLYGDWRAGTTGAISTGTIGSAGNQMAFAAGRCQYRPPSPSDRSGFRTHDQEFAIVSASGASDGDSFSLTLT